MIGAKLDGEAQRKKLISTRHPKQAVTRSIFAPVKQEGGKAQANVAEEGEHIGCMLEILRL